VAGVWKVCGVLCTEDGCEIFEWERGRVEVFFGFMVSRGREMRNQSQVCVVGIGRPVVGSAIVVGLQISALN
jgi:hypothetical protein